MDTENHVRPPHSEFNETTHGPNDPQTQATTSRSSSPSAHATPLPDERPHSSTEGPVHLASTSTIEASKDEESLENKNALVDTVTDKIRGESMSLPPDSPTKNPESIVPGSSNDQSGSDGDSSDKERSRKRKLSSRSSAANEVAVRLHPKRPKESDVPEREEDPEETTPSAKDDTHKPTQVFGFGSFASVKSPFATGQVNTSTVAPNASPRTASPPVVDSDSPKTQVLDNPPPSVALAKAQSIQPSKQPSTGGFSGFSTTSPFNRPPVAPITSSSEQRESLAGPVRRSKSPVGKHQAFGQYSAGVSRFGNLASRKTQEEASDRQPFNVESGTGDPVGFEDILKAKGEEAVDHSTGKLNIREIDYNTGEEDDLTVFQTRAKLYTQDETFAYKERGTGLLKVNVRRSDGEGARIVMRAEGVLRLLLNMPLYPGLICELGPDPKFIKVAEITTHERKLHAVKVGNAKVAQELYDHLMDNTPSNLVLPNAV
ncbi:hypothetical protein FS749_000129 [Ceratobasidium sp. UAMH 11750]|nr:hypothetical protein FS749_000129 [Ceratobasidium sp. UAMH 11750]